ncbi:MAG: hypothetical protein AAFV96_16255, partial [Pseudomonadota bacterium]
MKRRLVRAELQHIAEKRHPAAAHHPANPASVRAALAVLGVEAQEDGVGRVVRGRRVAFLGDMLELGPDEAALHAGLAEAAEMAGVD